MIRTCLHQRNQFFCNVYFKHYFSNLIISIQFNDLHEAIFYQAYRYIVLYHNLKTIVKSHEFKFHRPLIFLEHVYLPMLTLKFLTDFLDCILKLAFFLFFINIFENNVIVSLFSIFGRATVAHYNGRGSGKLRFCFLFLF